VVAKSRARRLSAHGQATDFIVLDCVWMIGGPSASVAARVARLSDLAPANLPGSLTRGRGVEQAAVIGMLGADRFCRRLQCRLEERRAAAKVTLVADRRARCLRLAAGKDAQGPSVFSRISARSKSARPPQGRPGPTAEGEVV